MSRTAIVAVMMLFALTQRVEGYTLLNLKSFDSVIRKHIKWCVQEEANECVIRFSLVGETYVLKRSFNTCGPLLPLTRMLKDSAMKVALFVEEAEKAAQEWSSVARVRFIYVDDPAHAQVLIGAQAVPNGHAFADLQIASVPGATVHEIQAAVICLNPRMILTTGLGDGKFSLNVRYVIGHELGHVIGVDHPSVGTGLMGFRYSPEHPSVTADDAAGACALYGCNE